MQFGIESRRERGAALYITLVVIFVVAGFSRDMLEIVNRDSSEQGSRRVHVARRYIAESGVRRAIVDLQSGGTGFIGTQVNPTKFAHGSYWVSAVDNGDESYTLTSRGVLQGKTRTVEAVVRRTGDLFHWAVYAGNSSGNQSYELEFGGEQAEADVVVGDVYSGQDITLRGDSSVTGNIEALGTINNATGTSGIRHPTPDLQGMHYEVHHDVNVAEAFDQGATLAASGPGGTAWELPETDPAHIFRKDPSDRALQTMITPGPDYFLEDPYQALRTDPTQTGTDPTIITLSPNGNRVVYFIDGNLWLHNRSVYSFKFTSPNPGGVQVTFVVKGNIYFSDNLYYDDPAVDGVAFIALQDSAAHPGSTGNIYFGDPVFGTLFHMDAFMYGENNFYDVNLDATGSREVQLNGTMSAGNQVNIIRDGILGHSKLKVNFDSRVKDGTLDLPGLPNTGAMISYQIVSWREVSPHM